MTTPLHILWVGVGGFLGSIARYSVSLLCRNWLSASFPWGTLLVNVIGCFAIGAVTGMAEKNNLSLQEPAIVFCTVGVLGGFTTFSAFGLETMGLVKDHQLTAAAANVALNLILGFSAVLFGRLLLGRNAF